MPGQGISVAIILHKPAVWTRTEENLAEVMSYTRTAACLFTLSSNPRPEDVIERWQGKALNK